MKILLVKLSSLGDGVHALPVVQDIRAALPDAVIACDLRRWRKAPFSAPTRQQWNAFKADLRQTPYDAVIDLQGLSKSALVARLARLAPGGQRYALANQTDGSGYEAPTRWVADVAIRMEPRTPVVQRSRELAAQALGYALAPLPDFGLRVPPASPASVPQIAFVHGTSRADKEWPLAHWIELGQRLNAAGFQIVLPHGNAKELATSRVLADALNADAPARAVVWPQLALDALTRQLARCAGVIGVDSGISHIAVALDLLHVQIYNFDTAWRTGPDGAARRQVSVFAQPAPGVEAVWRAWLACSAASTEAGTGVVAPGAAQAGGAGVPAVPAAKT
ncbi:MAG: lipopolysaccharide heptosyltransferase I [Polaromonas sp.]|nr:lipopolysaccharide heptosyltransferase I [Polaromonas sp.]